MEPPDLPSHAAALPCPLAQGWELIRKFELPSQAPDGHVLGGFSAVAYQQENDRLWLLSDARRSHLVPITGLVRALATGSPLQPGPRLLLLDRDGRPLPPHGDGEGLVLQGQQAWIVSEGRRTVRRRARLQRYDLTTGRLLQELPLPGPWLARPGAGLAANRGPESLTAGPRGELVLAAEAPLLQDNPPVVRLASSDGFQAPQENTSLRIDAPPVMVQLGGSGLSELLALTDPPGLLALVRSYIPPLYWSAQLQLLPWPSGPAAPPLMPITGWDLLAEGLPAENWEGLAWGPRLGDGRPSLVIVNDDNFKPFQRNWVAVLAPRQHPACRSIPSKL